MTTRRSTSFGKGIRALRRRASRAVTLLEYVLLGFMALAIIIAVTAFFHAAVVNFFSSVASNI